MNKYVRKKPSCDKAKTNDEMIAYDRIKQILIEIKSLKEEEEIYERKLVRNG